MSEEPSPFKGMPSWPEEAKDLPDAPVTRERYVLLYVLGGVAAFFGLPLGFVISRGDEAHAVGHAIFFGFVGLLVGYVLDRWRWNIAKQARK